MTILDRYVLRNFLVPFAYCFLGFLGIWLVFDLSDNAQDFLEAGVSPIELAEFYLMQLPQIVVLSMPMGLLLAVLYSLSRMSRSNEIISMLTAGKSVVRILVPLLVFGLIATAVSTTLNYRLAPHAEATKQRMFDQLTRGDDAQARGLTAHLFRNRSQHRTWFVQRADADSSVLEGVHISQQDAEGNLLSKFYAQQAVHDPAVQGWRLVKGKRVDFDPEGDIVEEQYWDEFMAREWTETPWRIASANLDPQELSVPELREYLLHNADFPHRQLAPYRTQLQYRWSVPWTCLLAVLTAAPLGIVYSRRGVLAGVAAAIGILCGMIFLDKFCLVMGNNAFVPPQVAAWFPGLLFAAIGLFLLYLRSANRELRTLFKR